MTMGRKIDLKSVLLIEKTRTRGLGPGLRKKQYACLWEHPLIKLKTKLLIGSPTNFSHIKIVPLHVATSYFVFQVDISILATVSEELATLQ